MYPDESETAPITVLHWQLPRAENRIEVRAQLDVLETIGVMEALFKAAPAGREYVLRAVGDWIATARAATGA